ncbi:glycosyltransferase family 39 protein [Candidatus Dojkabacteria bacterium]|uniref:Glycosyltransferase family 39 protein n=1 Tax=Candidatus Dojkabacteria bacterium TaxID=2099670 RepID=A0A847EUT0_9BACT|nr:glycosyltransferase family 39 protein [Candidatus Dojkabacteria bacterium]
MKLHLSKNAKIVLLIIFVYAISLALLSYFRFALYDEKLYLHETVMMSEILRNGEWIGNYGIGVHGFLFKLPVALVYLITGPSIYVATLFHIILASITAWSFYLLIEKVPKLKKWSVWAVLLLLSNYSFFSWSLTFHREIPMIFSLMLFAYNIINNPRKLVLNGFLLLLILDAKEYLFFCILPALGIYLLILKYTEIKNIWKSMIFALKDYFIILAPSLVFLILMFTTSIIPINMFNASFLGLTEGKLNYQIRQIEPEYALSDGTSGENSNKIVKVLEKIAYFREDSVEGRLSYSIFLFLGYLEKFLYVSNFSFQGIPLIILLCTLFSSIYYIKNKSRIRTQILFPFLFIWSYLGIYILRVSHQRYILPLVPFCILFFLLFLSSISRKETKSKKYLGLILLSSFLVSLILIFYNDFFGIKELFNIFSSIILYLIFSFMYTIERNRNFIVKILLVFVISASLFINIYSISTKNQIYRSSLWGVNGEAQRIAGMINPEDVIFVDCKSGTISEFTYLINFYRRNNYLPIEWHWNLNRNLVRRELDAIEISPNFYYQIPLDDMEIFEQEIKDRGINKIILLKSQVKDNKFPLEDYIEVFKNSDWVVLDTKEGLKNKDIYIFKVM